jgi:hypothetical protein
MWTLDFDLFIDRNTPTFLRKPMFADWLKVQLSPLTGINLNFASLAEERLEALKFTSQTLLFEQRLSTKFGETITITNNLIVLKSFLVQPAAFGFSSPLVFPFAFGYQSPICFPVAISVADEVMFEVNVPASLTAQEAQIRAEVVRYNHAGYTFAINFV